MPSNTTELEKRLRGAADELRANSKLKSSEYSSRSLASSSCATPITNSSKRRRNSPARVPGGAPLGGLTIKPVAYSTCRNLPGSRPSRTCRKERILGRPAVRRLAVPAELEELWEALLEKIKFPLPPGAGWLTLSPPSKAHQSPPGSATMKFVLFGCGVFTRKATTWESRPRSVAKRILQRKGNGQ